MEQNFKQRIHIKYRLTLETGYLFELNTFFLVNFFQLNLYTMCCFFKNGPAKHICKIVYMYLYCAHSRVFGATWTFVCSMENKRKAILIVSMIFSTTNYMRNQVVSNSKVEFPSIYIDIKRNTLTIDSNVSNLLLK